MKIKMEFIADVDVETLLSIEWMDKETIERCKKLKKRDFTEYTKIIGEILERGIREKNYDTSEKYIDNVCDILADVLEEGLKREYYATLNDAKLEIIEEI